MLDIREILLSSDEKPQKREDRFSLVGEDDGQGNIVLYRHYLYNPNKKTKPIKIPVKDFWGTAESFIGGVYKAQYLPKKKKGKKTSLEESEQKLKRLQKYLKAGTSKKKKTRKTKTCTKPLTQA